MIGLDTNVLVRYLAQDDPVQSPAATDVIERRLTQANPGYISVVVMAETAWVLERAYGLNAPAIAACIERVLQTDVLVVEHEQEVFTAMALLKQGSASFADSLILSLAEKAGCQTTLTFDRKALRLPGYSPA